MRIPDELRDETPTARGAGAGDVLQDQFELTRVLGSGGMGCVFEARDRHLERRVAVKVLPAFLGRSPRAAEALRKEAARAIELEHPAIARVYQYGIHQGQPFLVMQLVDGRDLAERLHASGPLPPAEALALLEPLAAALDYAHAKGVVHRDLKPANVLVRADGRPLLIDLGIASEVRDETTRLGPRQDSDTVGTLSYMSPEQVRGEKADPSMDRYSLAALAYELLAGEPPFFRGDPMNVQYQILNEPPRPIAGLDPVLWKALERGLAKFPAARFPTAASLVAALRGEAVPAPPPGPAPAPPDPAPAAGGPGLPATRAWLIRAVGLMDGLVTTLIGAVLWNCMAVPWYLQADAHNVASWSWLPFALHFLPPVFVLGPAFIFVMFFATDFLESRFPGVARPLLQGGAVGVALAGGLVGALMQHPDGRVPVLLAALLIALGMAAVAALFGNLQRGVEGLRGRRGEGPAPALQ